MLSVTRLSLLFLIFAGCARRSCPDCAPRTCPPLQRDVTGGWRFVDVSSAAGVAIHHGYAEGTPGEPKRFAAGIAAGDVDGDCDLDLYITTGDLRPEPLLLNRGDGTFVEAADAGVDRFFVSSAPQFADLDGDLDLDLVVGSVGGGPTSVLLNDGQGRFTEAALGVDTATRNTYATSTVDLEGDGDLDLVFSRWHLDEAGVADPRRVWRNDGETFTDISLDVGLPAGMQFDFSPRFADLDGDGDPDLALASDFGSSAVYLNDGGQLRGVAPGDLTDENGMGSALGDIDGDGDLDWFVTSVLGPEPPADVEPWGRTGNRLYRNDGGGRFTDISEGAGVRDGGWGWGSCLGDLDNDGRLDIYHVNGFTSARAPTSFATDSARLFYALEDGTFVDRAAELGVGDDGLGRGVLCQDVDRDGDLDLLVAVANGTTRLLRNDGVTGHFVEVLAPVGTQVRVAAAGTQWFREVTGGGSFQSGEPPEVHVGLGDATRIDRLEVRLADGTTDVWVDIAADQIIDVRGEGLWARASR